VIARSPSEKRNEKKPTWWLPSFQAKKQKKLDPRL